MLELLAPAGSMEAVAAAVQNGADAVYLGYGDFNARRNAKNFSEEEFAAAVSYCHVRGAKVYLTLNTLLTDRELPAAAQVAAHASAIGADAVLVQDMGVARMLRQAAPDLPVHASTQMTLHNLDGVKMAADLGMTRAVLSRELSRDKIEYICQRSPIEIEVFAHGALCMCYSGQCFLSSVIGGRSGNRGLCAQPCRLKYGWMDKADGNPLSLKDLSLAGHLRELRKMGVACVKLEGRMKRPEYVAVVTGIYARLLEEHRRPTAQEQSALEQAFSRSGFTDAYWRGRHGPEMFGTRPENAPEPKELFAAARAAYEKEPRTVAVDLSCRVEAGAPATLTASDRDGHTVTVTGPVPETARTRPLTSEDLESRLRKTGGTAFHCDTVTTLVGEGLSLSASAVNGLRRDALAALADARAAVPARREESLPPLPEIDESRQEPELTVSLADLRQLSPALLDQRPARVDLPLEQLESIAALPEHPGLWCAVLPRVWRDRDEEQLLRWLDHAQALGVTQVQVGNLGHLPLVRNRGLTLRGDFGLNVYNGYALNYLRSKGLESACVSFELRFSQIRDLPKILPAEAIVYGRLPLMITENCLIQNRTGCRLSQEGPAVPRQAPCRRPNVLNDRTGAAFPLLPAYGHRTEVQNSRPVWLADRPDWKRLGLAFARLRFTTETPETCARILRDYRSGASAPDVFTRGLYERGVT